MTDARTDSSSTPDRPGGGRWPWLLGGAVLAVVAVAIVVAVVGGVGGQPAPNSSPGSDASNGPTSASATPEATPTGDPTAVPTPSASTLPFDGEGVLGEQVSVSLTRLEAVEGEASSPGEVAGPSVRVTIDVANPTGDEVSLQSLAVTAYYGSDLVPALTLQAPGAAAFPQSVAAGASVQGIYVFSIPDDARDDVTVTVDLSAAQAQVVFRGSAPR